MAASVVLPVAVGLPPIAYLIDLDMVWLFAVIVGALVAVVATRRVQPRAERRSTSGDLMVLATSPFIVNLTWPVQRHVAARINP